MSLLSPEIVSHLISFQKDKLDWSYSEKSKENSMPKRQAEGAARLWNILEEHKIALLADEVGMGKTIQALSVITFLWKHKPGARVLIFAPNQAVVDHWEQEYRYFIKSHYKHKDDQIKTGLNGEPVYKASKVRNLRDDLCNLLREGWCHIFIAKTSSFSHLLSRERKEEIKERTKNNKERKDMTKEASKKKGEEIREKIFSILSNISGKNTKGFDLLVVDEAHYYRNISGTSLRVNSARGFLVNRGGVSLLLKKCCCLRLRPATLKTKILTILSPTSIVKCQKTLKPLIS